MSGIARGVYPVVLKAAGAQTASTVGPTIVVPDGYTRVRFAVNCTARSGTSPTLAVFIQTGTVFPAAGDLVGNRTTGTLTWNDLVSFASITNTGTQYASFIESSGFINAAQDAALTAGSIRAGVIGSYIRYKSTITATTPSFTYSVFAEFLP